MKLHLPSSLLSAVLLVAAGLTSQAQAVEVPSDYTPHYIADPDDLSDYRADSGNHAFLLDGSITFTPSSATWWTSSQELKENGSILFTIEEDSAPYSLTFKGGANKAFYNVSTLAIEDIGRVTFESLKESDYDDYAYYSSPPSSSSPSYYNHYYYYGGAIHATTLRLKGNSRVTFTGNEVIANSSNGLRVYGGAIYGADGATITISETSGAVTFAQNKATSTSSSYYSYSASYGGAIYGGISSTISISGNAGAVNFTGNSSDSSSSYSSNSYGGAIYGGNYSTISICDNEGDVSFTGNSSYNSAYSAYNSGGGAIYGASSTISICDNRGDVSFTGNSSYSYSTSDSSSAAAYCFSGGGAIYGESSISICDNGGDVSFTGNSSYSYSSYFSSDSYGGAIRGANSSTISISGNAGDVNITENTASASYSYGGAIYGGSSSTISICDNGGDVNITDNSASYGGAIYGVNSSTISISGNAGAVNFTGNSSDSYYSSCGGAIYGGNYSTISICDNEGDVSFTGNSSDSSSYYYYSCGGAIYGGSSSTISICGNTGDINITDNSSSSYSSSTLGGAIHSKGSLYLQNNGNTLIAGNYEKVGSNYRLRSIYMSSTASDGGYFHLSAAAGKNIEFQDSVYIGSYATVELNADYTTSEGKVIKQEGDIIFTGAYAETHLNELLTTAGAGRTATAEEIANSRTSEMRGKVTLYGGTLRVEEQAVLKTTAGLNVAAGSNATVKVSNAALDAGSSDINVGNSGTLMLMNGATVKAANINIANGATFAVVAAPAQEAVATFSRREAASVAELTQSCLVNANLTFEAGSTLVADGVYFSMAEGSTLTFKALTGGGKINLVLTLGAEYSINDQVVLFSDADVVRFILDGEELNVTDSILANTFFTGAWVNDETTLSYDSSSGTISLQHLNTVSIPEPTTATLSLLALAGLAARRRRK